MGRRKLQFDHRKNYERKKYGYGLHLKIPLEILRPLQLVVQLPISAYTSATVPDPGVLRSRLVKSRLIPSGWTVADEGSQLLPGLRPPLVLYKRQALQVLVASSPTLTLSVDDQLTWTIRVETSPVSPENCEILRGYASTLGSLDDIVQLLSRIE